MQTVQFALLLIFPALVIVAALKDATSFTIPNWISLALIVAFVPAAIASGASLASIGLCVAAGLSALLLGMGMFAAGWIGGGDAKLFAAATLWLGWPAALPFMLITGMAGGVLTLGLLSLRSGWFEPVLAGSPPWVRKLGAQGGDIPYGVAIAVGALVALPQGALAQAMGA
ncbi:prepilin peptidase [soil metagenome]